MIERPRPQFTAWISKYALSEGIYSREVEQCVDVNPSMVRTLGTGFQHFHGEGVEWHRTREGAVERAHVVRENKIASLKRQIQKLDKLTFADT